MTKLLMFRMICDSCHFADIYGGDGLPEGWMQLEDVQPDPLPARHLCTICSAGVRSSLRPWPVE